MRSLRLAALEEVQKMLGKRARTALKSASGAVADPSHECYVNSWDWATH